jgi:TldD protein
MAQSVILAETDLSLEAAQSEVVKAVQGADDGEAFFERTARESFTFDDGRLKGASYDSAHGFGLRVVAGEQAGYAHADEISLGALRRASETVVAAKRGYSGTQAAPPAATNQSYYGDSDPVAQPGFEDKITILQEIDAFTRALDPRVVQVSATLSAERRVIEIIRADTELRRDIRPLCRIDISVTVERDGKRESTHAGAGGRGDYAQWLNRDTWQGLAREALRQATVNLDAIAAPAGEMDVVLGPGWPGVLLHEAVGHGLEGDFNRKGTSAFSGKVGQRVAAKGVTVVDDGTLHGRRGSITIDDEGTPSSCTTLIEDGILVGYMQDRQNARLMGVAPTGNGRRQSYAHTPMPRMTNTYMLGGDHDPAEIVRSMKRGLYAVNFGGGQVDITNGKFVFQCTEAYLVEDGKITAPVKGATLIGDGPSALTRVTMIGNDMQLDPGVGVCGKAGQGVPVGVGQPTLKITGLTVGGTG